MGDSDFTRAKANCYNTSTGDLLGVEGRKAVNACVKVKIYGKPETRKYDRETVISRLRRCHRGRYPNEWIFYGDLTLPVEFDKTGMYCTDLEKTYSIIDIRDALVKLDNRPFVEKYPKDGTSSERKRELIDKRRADVEREWNEAIANPDGQQILYSWSVAQRRVRDCYAGNFAGDAPLLIGIDGNRLSSLSIKSIHDAVIKKDEGCLEKFSFQNKSAYEEIHTRREHIVKEYQQAIRSHGTPRKYSEDEAEQRLRDCYCGTDGPLALDKGLIFRSFQNRNISIFDIHDQLCYYDRTMQQSHKYPPGGPGSEELKQSIDEHRAKLKEDYEKFLATSDVKKPQMLEYSSNEAELLLRDCFAFIGSSRGDTDMFPRKKDQIGMPRIYQTFTILDIKESLEYFDAKKFLDKYPKQGEGYDKEKKGVDEERKSIEEEYEEAITHVEIEHGSGFIISDHFILTNKHVIETYLNDKNSYVIRISNAAIGELHCEVAHIDPFKDLALLYCLGLNLQEGGICALQLSTLPLLPGMQIFSFGYPVSHTEETALFVTGNVSGSKRTLSGHSMAVLNCSLNSGNSGGPVLSWVGGKVRVVGIATQKHIKRILTPNERKAILEIRKSLQIHAIDDVQDHDLFLLSTQGKVLSEIPPTCQVSINLLTLKLYYALETHTQFNLSNALPGNLVVEFIKNFIPKYKGEHKEELDKVIELSQ